MLQYWLYWVLARRVMGFVVKGLVLAVVVRVGSYWVQHHALPPLSLLEGDAMQVYSWLSQSGIIQWGFERMESVVGSIK